MEPREKPAQLDHMDQREKRVTLEPRVNKDPLDQ